MRRSDDLPTSHPKFALVLYNNKIRNQLQKLGSVCLNTEDVNPYTTLDDLQNLWTNDDDHKKYKENYLLLHLTFLELSPIGYTSVMNLKVHLFSFIY